MGLTGHVLEVELALERIPSPWILTETRRVGNIDEYLRALSEEAARWPYTVGWIDCLKAARRWAAACSNAAAGRPRRRRRAVCRSPSAAWRFPSTCRRGC
jgi:hypothetical protein